MNVQKALNWTVKIAGVIITAPATVVVAGSLFSDLPPLARYSVQGAAVLLVEGVFLSNWLLLETDKRADTAYKVRYSLTALGLYVGLWVLAWSHGEGVAGIVFRLALGAALLGTIYEAGVYDILRSRRKADKDITHVGRVKRLSRKLSIADTSLQLRLDSEHRQAVMQAEHEARMEDVQRYGERLIKEVQTQHYNATVELYGPDTERSTRQWRLVRQAVWERDGKACTECGTDLSKPTDEYHCHHILPVAQGGKTTPDNLTTLCPECHRKAHGGEDNIYPMNEARQVRQAQQRIRKEKALDTLLDTLVSNPDVSKTTLADTLGVSRSTVYSYLEELSDAGRIVQADTGSGYALAGVEYRANGRG